MLREPAAFGRYTARPGVTFEIPAIVDEATFRAADAKLRSNNTLSGPKPTVLALLRKRAVCGICGSPVYIQLGGGGKRIRYYYCRAKDPACLRYHRVRETDARIIRALRKWAHDEWHLYLVKPPEPAEAHAALERDIARARRELKDLDRQEKWLARQGRKGLISETVAAGQLSEIVRDRNEAMARIASAEAQLASAERTEEDAKTMREQIDSIRRGWEEMTYEDWASFAQCLFPRGGVRFFPNGRLDLAGWLPAQPDASPASGTR
jgi:hypothetical protein